MEKNTNTFNEAESINLIASMIRNTQNKMSSTTSTIFIIWGVTTSVISLIMWYIGKYLTPTSNYYYLLWWALPIIGYIGTIIAIRNEKKERYVKTFIDSVISKIWMTIGIAILIIMISNFLIQHLPILFILLILISSGSAITFLIVKFKFGTICAIITMLISSLCLIVKGIDSILISAAAFAFLMIIPGIVLKNKGEKIC